MVYVGGAKAFDVDGVEELDNDIVENCDGGCVKGFDCDGIKELDDDGAEDVDKSDVENLDNDAAKGFTGIGNIKSLGCGAANGTDGDDTGGNKESGDGAKGPATVPVRVKVRVLVTLDVKYSVTEE